MKKVLVADDEEVLRMLIVDTLEDEGFAIDEASDGEEAWQFLQNNQYDLVILDYMMPGYTGLELLEKIKKAGNGDQGKILMLSAKSQASEKEQVLQAGADSFMAKPFSPLKLIELVEELLDETN